MRGSDVLLWFLVALLLVLAVCGVVTGVLQLVTAFEPVVGR